jgi:glutaredoxin
MQSTMSQKVNNRREFNVVLYTRNGCHLCDDAEQLLRQEGMTPTLIDIDTDSELQARFDTCVPVVEIDGRVRFRGRVDRVLLLRILGRS